MLDFIVENFDIILSVLGVIVIFISNLFCRKSLSKTDKNKILEVLETLKYRLPDYNHSGNGTSFSNMKDEYSYCSETNMLTKLDTQIDLQKQLNSFNDTALDAILERFMPVTREELKACDSDEIILSMQQSKDDLVSLGDLLDEVATYRDELGLSPFATIPQIIEEAKKRASTLDAEIKQKMNVGGVKSEEKKTE